MEHDELQRRLAAAGFYRGRIDGQLGPPSMQAIAAFLHYGQVAAPVSWSRTRRVLAAKQLICRGDGIEVGPIDGLLGPQTAFAFERYAQRARGDAPTLHPGRALDPPDSEPVNAFPGWPREPAVERHFGPMGINQVRLQLPYPMRLAWQPSTGIRSFLVHERVHDSAARCFERIADAYDAEARRAAGLDLFAGCFNVRRKRGGDSWSMHSWGIAIDFDSARNGLRSHRGNARLAQPDCETFWRIWEDEGWLSLGRARDFDWMHLQAARL